MSQSGDLGGFLSQVHIGGANRQPQGTDHSQYHPSDLPAENTLMMRRRVGQPWEGVKDRTKRGPRSPSDSISPASRRSLGGKSSGMDKGEMLDQAPHNKIPSFIMPACAVNLCT